MNRIKRMSGERLRELLTHPEQVDVDTFNREVWNYGHLIIDGQRVRLAEDAPEERLREIETALESGRAQFQGTLIWGSGTRIYAARLKNDEEKLANIRRTLQILNEPGDDLLDKARRMREVKYMGNQAPSGMLMLLHPTRFALFNGASRQGLHLLGFPTASLDEFEDSAHKLKEIVGAEDFIELDEFLEQVFRGNITFP